MSDIIVKDVPFSNSTKGNYHVYKGNGIILYVSKGDMPNGAIPNIRLTIEPA